jgi:hypothetical protein
VVQNQLNRIVVVRVDDAGTTGIVLRLVTSPDFDVSTIPYPVVAVRP